MFDDNIQHGVDQIAFWFAFRQQNTAFQIQFTVFAQIIFKHLVFTVSAVDLPQQVKFITLFQALGAISTLTIP